MDNVKPDETTDAAAEDMDEGPDSVEPNEMPTIAAEDEMERPDGAEAAGGPATVTERKWRSANDEAQMTKRK